MKYIVMECHPGYAILMDEASGFVEAANLHYEVGQTVTNPILMRDAALQKRNIRQIIVRTAAAAACLLLVSAAGFGIYARNFRTHAVVLIGSGADIRMDVNRKGKVLSLRSENASTAELLKSYQYTGKTKTDVANELLAMEIEEGYLASGDTVELYIAAGSTAAYDTYKTEFEQEISKIQLKVNVQTLDSFEKSTPDPKPAPEKDASKPQPKEPEQITPKEPAAQKPADPAKDHPAAPQPENGSQPQKPGVIKPTEPSAQHPAPAEKPEDIAKPDPKTDPKPDPRDDTEKEKPEPAAPDPLKPEDPAADKPLPHETAQELPEPKPADTPDEEPPVPFGPELPRPHPILPEKQKESEVSKLTPGESAAPELPAPHTDDLPAPELPEPTPSPAD